MLLVAMLLLTLLQTVSRPAAAASTDFPTRPIRFIVAGPPGGSLDLVARSLQEPLRQALGQAVIVENRAGAGGTLAAREVTLAAADGHTWLLGFNGPLAFAPYLYRDLPYQPQRDLQAVVLTTSQPNLIVAHRDFPASDVAGLIAALKARPGNTLYASVGNGSSSHLTMEWFKSLTGTDMGHVPFDGAGAAVVQAIVNGEVQLLATVPTALLPHIASGRIKPIAVTGSKRLASLANIPTLRESGIAALKDFESTAWNGVLVPAGTPRATVLRINAAINTALKDSAVQKRLQAAGLEPMGGTPEAFARLVATEIARWAPVIRATGAKVD
jgi:tripartite-type tricarboxylate transporter receptor subunit TctC